MKRKAMEQLSRWKNKENRKPLLIYGARQVGKTYLVKQFAKQYFDELIYVNFETNKIVGDMINENIDPKEIIKNLEIIFQKKIDKTKTLIFFDEIQCNPRALTSLKYFCELASEFYVIGAGSLLGVHIHHQNYSFPVGKVEFLTVYPFSFEEFLMNTNNYLLCEEIKKCYRLNKKMEQVLHDKALDLYRDYLITGGMPEVVKEYIQTNSLVSAVDIQTNIIESYRGDMSKYTESKIANKIIMTYNSIPVQLAKDNKKFQYKVVQKGGTSTIFGESVDWLVTAGIANKCYKTKIGVPLKMYEEIDSFKLYMNDVGLLTNMSEFPLYFIKNQSVINESMIGMLTENYVCTAFRYNGLNLNYWQNSYTSEVDFILQSHNGLIIPVEVKANENTRSRSLTNYIKEFNPDYAIRISAKNFGFTNNIKSVPLYAVFCITSDTLDEK